jgi:integrative and conjugative element protein (TIGR02256 family)
VPGVRLIGKANSSRWVLIEDGVFTRLDPYRQISVKMPEAGGILLGFRRGKHLHVLDATTPMRGDIGQRYRFERSSAEHQRVALQRWQQSGGTLDYVGEWHSHPELNPLPSSIDLGAWRELCRARKDPLGFLIIGSRANWFGLGTARSLKALKLEQVKSPV